MIYRVLLFIIGVELLLLGLTNPDERLLFFVCAGIVHGVVIADMYRPGTIKGLMK